MLSILPHRLSGTRCHKQFWSETVCPFLYLDLELFYSLGLSLNTDPTCCQCLWSYDLVALYTFIIPFFIWKFCGFTNWADLRKKGILRVCEMCKYCTVYKLVPVNYAVQLVKQILMYIGRYNIASRVLEYIIKIVHCLVVELSVSLHKVADWREVNKLEYWKRFFGGEGKWAIWWVVL